MTWILWTVLALAAAVLIVGLILLLYIRRKLFHRRYDGNKNLKYYSAADFNGLQVQYHTFSSVYGVAMKGYLYSRGSVPEGLILFAHGFGAGHDAYTTEINTLTEAGFWVFTYDCPACGKSDGEKMRGFEEGPLAVRAAVEYVSRSEELSCLPLILAGHSWGGFSVMNAAAQCSDRFCGVLSMCGFLSGAGIAAQFISEKLHSMYYVFKPILRFYNWIRVGGRVNFDSRKSLDRVKVPVCLLYGESDTVVSYRYNGGKMEKWAKGRKNVSFYKWRQKGHNVYLCDDAEKYMNDTFAEISRAYKQKKEVAPLYEAIDYNRMTREDPQVMKIVVDFCINAVRTELKDRASPEAVK